MSAGDTQLMCPHCGSRVMNLAFHFGLHEACGEVESKRRRGTGLIDKMKGDLVEKINAAESVRLTVSQSEKNGELSRPSHKSRKMKKKSKPPKEEKKIDSKTFSGSFTDYMTHLQEGKEERDQRELNERLKRAAAVKAKKRAELDSALSFIDGQLQSGTDLSDDDEEKQTIEKEEESMFQWIKNYKSERRERSDDWTRQVTWGEIKGQNQSSQMSEVIQAPSTISNPRRDECLAQQVSAGIPDGKVQSKVKMEEDLEDRVTQDMCSTSVSTDAKPQELKTERVQVDVREKKLCLFVQSGVKKFQVSLGGQKRVKKVRVAVAGQLQVDAHRVELQVDGRRLHDSSRVGDLHLSGSSIIATLV